MSTSRRTFVSALAAAGATLAARPPGVIVDTHIHLFAKDQTRFPCAPTGTYRPEPADLEDYKLFVAEAQLTHGVIVHPEPYQDDHSYLEYCFENEPSPSFFKGTCLLDSARGDTPDRLRRLMQRCPDRIVAMRVHAVFERGTPPSNTGPITGRGLTADYMKRAWRTVADAGIAIQMHMRPFYAPQVQALMEQFPQQRVVIDHLGRAGMGTPDDYRDVLALAKYPNVYMKYSGLEYSSKTGYPFEDVKPIVRQAYDAFGPDRMIWGYFGMNMAEFEKNAAVMDNMFDFASEEDRAKVRGETAVRLYGF